MPARGNCASRISLDCDREHALNKTGALIKYLCNVALLVVSSILSAPFSFFFIPVNVAVCNWDGDIVHSHDQPTKVLTQKDNKIIPVIGYGCQSWTAILSYALCP